jgi:methionine sulfoxide reductase heme-binding subunit
VIAATGSSSPALWYLTRATGAVTLVLLSAVMVLGVLNVTRLSSPRWPRFVIDGLHRHLSLLALAMLGVHIVTTLMDSYVTIGLLDAVIPFHGSYRPVWLGLGAAALDLMLAVTVTSLLRARIGVRAWRGIHWLAYACWPLAVAHGIGIGTDVLQSWMLVIDVVCVSAVLIAVVVRVRTNVDLTSAGGAVAR